MKKQHFTVVIEWDGEAGVYVGEVPGLPACHSQGKTMDELMKNMREVTELCLEVQKIKPSQMPKFIGVQQIEVSA